MENAVSYAITGCRIYSCACTVSIYCGYNGHLKHFLSYYVKMLQHCDQAIG